MYCGEHSALFTIHSGLMGSWAHTKSDMKLPSEYREVVRLGATTLQLLADRLREVAANKPERPELWLSVRDFQGLAGRLADSTDWEWRHGYADIMISPQDFGVLDELLAHGGDELIPYSREDATALTGLREFLRQYCAREFELDEPAA